MLYWTPGPENIAQNLSPPGPSPRKGEKGAAMSRETMTARQRILTALNHAVPDRVPIDLGGNQTGIHRFAYQALLDHLGIHDEPRHHGPRPAARAALRGGARAVPRRYAIHRRRGGRRFDGDIVATARDGRLWHDLTDEFGVTWSMPDDHPYYMDISHHPLAEATIEDIRNYPFPRGDDPGRFAGLRQRASELRRDTPYAVVSGISGVVYEICWYLRGLEQWFTDMLTQPEFCEALLDETLNFWMDWFRGFLDEVGDLVDVIMIGDDLAARRGRSSAPTSTAASSSRGTAASRNTSARGPRPKSGTIPAAHARSTFPTCSTTASTSSIRCRSAPRGWTRPP